MANRHVTEKQRVLADLAKQDDRTLAEISLLVSPGSTAGPWTVKIESHIAYNVYSVKAVVIGSTGLTPVEVGQEVEAVNMAEPFTSDGVLTAGTYVVMFHVGDKNVFFVQP